MAFAKKDDWEKTRPSSCKGSGVGAACKLWESNCPADVARLVTDANKLKLAETAMGAMLTALLTGEGKLSKADKGDAKKVEPTKTLIKDWRTEVSKYATKIADEQKKLNIANLAAANKVIDKAFDITKVCQTNINAQKKEFKAKVDALQTLAAHVKQNGPKMQQGEAKAALQKVNELSGAVAQISLLVSRLMEQLRSDIVFFRGPGAAGIAKAHNLGATAQNDLAKRFTEHKALMDKIELDCKTVNMLGQKINVDTVAIQEGLKKTWDVLPGYQKILQQVLVGVRESKKELSIKNNPGIALKTWTPERGRNSIELQITSCQMVLDTFKKVDKRIDQLMDQGKSHIPQDMWHSSLEEIWQEIKKEQAEFDKAKLENDKEATEGIAFGKRLLETAK